MLRQRTAMIGLVGLALMLAAVRSQAAIVGQDDFESYGELNPAPDPLNGTAAGGLLWNYIDGQGDGIQANDHRTFMSPAGIGAGFDSIGWISLEEGGGIGTSISLAALAGTAFDNGAGGIVDGSVLNISFAVAAETSNTGSDIGFSYDISSSGGTLGFLAGGSANGSTTFASLGDGGTVVGGTVGASDDRRMTVEFDATGVALADAIDFSITRGTGTNNPFIFFDDFVFDAPELLTLTVNTTTGAATISNEFSESLDIIAYSITSDSMSLTPATWSPLEDNPLFGNGIPDDGIGFEVLSATPSELAEADLTGFATFNPNDSVGIGSIFAPGMPQDLVFTLGLLGGTSAEANVAYVMGGVNGDFNMDGNWDCADINALVAALASGSTDLSFDMNGDGVINANDITDSGNGWLAVGGANNPDDTGGNPFLVGDATLDGVVDGLDFIEWNNNKFTAVPEWCGGDFTADGIVDGLDFIQWNNNKFTSSDHAVAVPEPVGGLLLLSGIVALFAAARKSKK